MFLEILADSTFGALIGSVTGFVGQIAKNRQEVTVLKENNRHVEELQELNRQAENQRAENQLVLADLQGVHANTGKAIDAESVLGQGVSQEVADKRAMFRMRATVGLWGLSLVLLAFGVFTKTTSDPMFVALLTADVQAATAAIFFWFGGKAVSSKHR